MTQEQEREQEGGPAAAGDGRDGPPRRTGRHRIRRSAAWVLVVVASLLVPLSVTTVWAVNTVTNTDHYVATLSPLVTDPVVNHSLAVRATDTLFQAAEVQQELQKSLPRPVAFLAAPLTAQLHTYVQRQIETLLNSAWFHRFWDSVNTKTHAAMVAVLSGQATPAKRAHGVIADLSPVLTKAIDTLDAHGITVFNGVKATVARADTLTLNLATSAQVAKARTAFSLAKDLGWLAPLLAVVVIVAALAVAMERRRTLLRVAMGAGSTTVALLAGLALGRSFFVSHAAAGVSPAVTTAVFDILLRFLVQGLRNVVLACATVAALMWLAGPAGPARWLRAHAADWVRRAAGWTWQRGRELASPARRRQATAAAATGARWVLDHRSGLRTGGVVVAGAVILLGGNLSVSGVWTTLIVLVVYLGLVEVVMAWARRIPPPSPDADGAGGPGTAAGRAPLPADRR